MVLFMQHLKSFVTFQNTTFIKTNILTLLHGSALEWYTSELNNFNRDALNNDLGMKSWINTLSYRLKIPTSDALGLLTNKTYSLDNM